jgi:hypothetical protein
MGHSKAGPGDITPAFLRSGNIKIFAKAYPPQIFLLILELKYKACERDNYIFPPI